jgi:hypothetical protein
LSSSHKSEYLRSFFRRGWMTWRPRPVIHLRHQPDCLAYS